MVNLKAYSPQQLQEAREYAASYHTKLATLAGEGKIAFASHMTKEDIDQYISFHTELAEEIKRGESDSNFTVLQRMVYFLTGEDFPLLRN